MTVPASVTNFCGGQPIPAKSTARYTAAIVDEGGTGIPAAVLASLKLSLYDADTGLAVNSISAVNILNTGRGVIDSSGNLTLTLLPADTVTIGSPAPDPGTIQYRSMVIDWVYNGGNSQGRHQVDFAILALAEA
jgi:hypothetical protein